MVIKQINILCLYAKDLLIPPVCDGQCSGCIELSEERDDLQDQLETLQAAVVAEGSVPLCPMCLQAFTGWMVPD